MKGHKKKHGHAKPPARSKQRPHELCRGWDYESHPQLPRLGKRCVYLINWIRRETSRFDRYGLGLKPAHRFLFLPMVPKACSCIAGTFRGDPACPTLVGYNVRVLNDLRVGTPAEQVANEMARFESECAADFQAYRDWSSGAGASESETVKLSAFVKLLSLYLQQFLTIHPFANGNGHMGRFLVMLHIIRHGFSLGAWPLDDSPDYGAAITAHRDGNDTPLRLLILMAMKGVPLPLRLSRTP